VLMDLLVGFKPERTARLVPRPLPGSARYGSVRAVTFP
jgi:hypothetical protein